MGQGIEQVRREVRERARPVLHDGLPRVHGHRKQEESALDALSQAALLDGSVLMVAPGLTRGFRLWKDSVGQVLLPRASIALFKVKHRSAAQPMPSWLTAGPEERLKQARADLDLKGARKALALWRKLPSGQALTGLYGDLGDEARESRSRSARPMPSAAGSSTAIISKPKPSSARNRA